MNKSLEFYARSVQESDLTQISRIHIKSFRESALSMMGNEVVKRQYHWLLTGPHEVIAVCAVNSKGDLAGFCFSGNFNGAMSGFINKNRAFLFKHIVFHPWVLLNPIVIKQSKTGIKIIFSSLKSNRKHEKMVSQSKSTKARSSKPCTLLSIAVDPVFQRQGIGEILMSEVELRARDKKFEVMILTVHPDNSTAVRFYEKLDWEKISSGQNWNGKMKKKLE